MTASCFKILLTFILVLELKENSGEANDDYWTEDFEKCEHEGRHQIFGTLLKISIEL